MNAFSENMIMALRSVGHNKIRSILTLLGVLIGVASVVALTALGQGAQHQVSSNLQTLGSNLIQISSGQTRGASLIRRGPGSTPTLTEEDFEYVLSLRGKGVLRASPELSSNQQIRSGSLNTSAQVYGVNSQYPFIRNLNTEGGVWFSPEEEAQRKRVAVLGYQAAQDLFPQSDAVGSRIRIRNLSFTVVGVLESKGNFMGDRSAYLPLETYRRYVAPSQKFSSFSLQAETPESMEDLQAALTAGLLELHQFSSLEEADFSFVNQQDIIKSIQSTTATFTLLLTGIAGISLVVGGIGIMNIMLVSVTERTREIGLRRALGARQKDILAQFLTEAVVLSLLGGLLGLLTGLGTAWGLKVLAGMAVAVSWESGVLALGFSGAIGLFFGGWPAYRASRLDPIEALRYE